MKYELRLSLDIEFETSELQVLPEAAGTYFMYLEQLLDVLSRLIHDTPWPASRQGEFIDYVVRDVYEFGCAIRTEAEAGRWTVAMALIRPLQERSEYALAAAVDTTFPKRYVESINEQIDKNFTARSRQLADIARGAIDRWVRKSHGQDGLLVLQRQFREGCGVMPAWRRGAWHGSVWPVRYCPAYPQATAATRLARTVPGAAFPAPPG